MVTKMKEVAIVLSVLLFSGCPRTWHLTIIDVSDPTHPHFCISRYKNCRGHGIGFDIVDIWEVSEKGEDIKLMWAIEPVTNSRIKELVYGIPPQGFKQKMTPIPLEVGNSMQSMADSFSD
jgi:hypothetical protein